MDSDLQILQCEVDEEGDSEFRFLLNGSCVKYVTIDPGLFDPMDMTFGPSLFPLLPRFPEGDWNIGRVSADANGKPRFASATKISLAAITSTWHQSRIDILQLDLAPWPRSNVCQVRSGFPTPAMAKFARFPQEVPYFEAETRKYQWIEGQQIGPRFLGHLTEHGRVMGFLVEEIVGARHAGPEDLNVCREALARLHKLGIKHGDINRHNFLIQDARAILIDFENAESCKEAAIFAEEMEGLESALRDTFGRGGVRRVC